MKLELIKKEIPLKPIKKRIVKKFYINYDIIYQYIKENNLTVKEFAFSISIKYNTLHNILYLKHCGIIAYTKLKQIFPNIDEF